MRNLAGSHSINAGFSEWPVTRAMLAPETYTHSRVLRVPGGFYTRISGETGTHYVIILIKFSGYPLYATDMLNKYFTE
ncbi:hypothetical protein RSJ42_16145 [Methanosarcina hadiensis]|uniref:hypothetical protein n=1 Tax=Methanosarcina hadiensis TaxID=3078083 RepID=UPI0039777589